MVSQVSWILGVLGLLLAAQIDQRKTPEQQIEEAVSPLPSFVDRSLALRKEGKDTPARVRTLNEEIQSGKISMPPQAVLYSRQGNSSEISDGVVIFHIPNATRETTGLPTLPTPGFPWLAEAGTPMANIRIPTP
jgi:hypothetical protein